MSRPSIFADLELDAALAEAAAQAKLLLVDATAAWCGPCKTMDRTTWVDPVVVDALREKAIAIQIDVDEKAETAKRLSIMAMPTVIAFRDGAEFDRVVGLQRRDELLAWLDGLARGETSLQRQRIEVAAKPGDMQERMRFASSLLQANQLDQATKEFLWLWEHVLEHEPAMVGVRHSYLVADLQRLCEQHPPARAAVEKLRDAAAPKPGAAPDTKTLPDWFSLNEALGEPQRALAWFDEAHPKANGDKRLARLLEHKLAPLLIESNRWSEAGTLFADPLATLKQTAELKEHTKEMPPEMAAQVGEFAVNQLRADAAMLVRALKAAHRDAEARSIGEEAKRLDDSPEMAAGLSEAESAPR